MDTKKGNICAHCKHKKDSISKNVFQFWKDKTTIMHKPLQAGEFVIFFANSHNTYFTAKRVMSLFLQ